jgi:hypothetical protein
LTAPSVTAGTPGGQPLSANGGLDFCLFVGYISYKGISIGRRSRASVQGFGGTAVVAGFCECEAVSQNMSTFVSGKKAIDSRLYLRFMSTFAYRVEKAGRVKSKT